MAQVKQGLEPLSPTDTVLYSEAVVAGMTGNADFPTPVPPLAEATTLSQNIRADQERERELENELAAVRASIRTQTDALKALLRGLGSYVQGIADAVMRAGGNAVAVVQGANMEVRDEAKPIGDLPAPAKTSLADGHDDGTLEAHCSKVHGASSYLWQTCTGNDPIGGVWGGDKVTTKTAATLTGFAQSTRVWMRVAGIGASDSRVWSAPVSAIVT